MMLQFTDIQPLVDFSEKVPQNVKSLNVIAIYNTNGNFSLPSLSTNTSVVKCDQTEKCINKKNIYVCTFCQVFSPHFITVAHHISSVHFDSLPIGTSPENFISKLQSLEGTVEKKKGKVGRPRKNLEQNVSPPVIKQPVVDPIPDDNGLFWCKKCLRHFRKSRQLTQHICQDSEEEFSFSDSSIELEEDMEFKTHMNVDPIPWSRRKRIQKLKENCYDSASSAKTNESSVPDINNEILESKVIPNWRNDPSYIPLFDDEKEKAAFEEHLKSIDYSCVDNLFQVEEKRCRSKSKSPCVYVQSIVYTCNYCKKALKSLSLIRLHCLIHTDVKPFTCPKCTYRSNSKGSLYMHMRTHTGNVFCCSLCDFKCNKRSHLLDHEATHSTVSQICKLCKNSYKTVRSLIAHIRKYHNYAGGKRYIKSLTSKRHREFKCDICNKKFKTEDTLQNHNHACHKNETVSTNTLEVKNHSDPNSENLENVVEIMQVEIPNGVDQPSSDLQCNNVQAKDPLAEIVLNNFLQQEQSQAIMYENVFSDPSESILPSSANTLLEGFQAKTVPNGLATETSVLEECQKTLNLDILNECLQNRNFSNECDNFNLISNISAEHSLQNNNSEANSNGTSHLNGLSEDKGEEHKSVEIKLFEKCQRAPAYVCCVCSSIYICPSTLKAHLKEHVNNTSSSLIDQAEVQYEPAKISEATNELDVCHILQDSSESCSYDEELEKLYTSSLDMMYYLPEVSVVLENDPALFDSMLDDISNFPISVSSPNDLSIKEDEDENILKCFDGL